MIILTQYRGTRQNIFDYLNMYNYFFYLFKICECNSLSCSSSCDYSKEFSFSFKKTRVFTLWNQTADSKHLWHFSSEQTEYLDWLRDPRKFSAVDSFWRVLSICCHITIDGYDVLVGPTSADQFSKVLLSLLDPPPLYQLIYQTINAPMELLILKIWFFF